ncbi:MAG: cation:proton antiporter [Geminocystis sp.]|nr:cation:proton antiporter [Geminocystis sp.]HIK37303.1 cation:proton antiporter [Geminocystis sp. M7585_C2015_104]
MLFATVLKAPLASFTILLLLILVFPPIFEKIRLPGLVGLLFAGVIFGEDGLGLLDKNSEAVKLLADIGKIYLMFVAGLEIDVEDFRKARNKSLLFGFTTFIVPLSMGTLLGLAFQMGWNASILLGSLLASHTLLAYPIVTRLGVVNNEAVIATIGATIFTDIGALVVLAICVAVGSGQFTLATLIGLLFNLAIYCVIVLFGFAYAGREYFRRTGEEESNQFLFVLLAVFLASVGAQLIHVDQIVGAFLAGLAVNRVVGQGVVKEKIEFVGSTLFIPCFFVYIGLLLKVSEFLTIFGENSLLTIGIVSTLILSKFIASWIPKLVFNYSWDQCLTMWSLSLPQVAATLAATVVGIEAGILPKAVFNSVIVMMLVTSVGGPILTSRFAPKLLQPEIDSRLAERRESGAAFEDEGVFPLKLGTIVLPLSSPKNQRGLMELAAILSSFQRGKVIALSVVRARAHLDDPMLQDELQESERLIKRALKYGKEYGVVMEPVIRIDDDFAEAICRVAREKEGDLIILGWSPSSTSVQARIFGNIVDKVLWSSHCPVAVVKLLNSPSSLKKILVPVENLEQKTLKMIALGSLLAQNNGGTVTVLYIQEGGKGHTEALENVLRTTLGGFGYHGEAQIKIKATASPADTIIRTAVEEEVELVLLEYTQYRTAGGLAVSDVTTEVIGKLDSSVIIFG